ncbi:hypothetical protein [Streptomyces sp. MBT58]|uniref:hypothetical protein n=1 Tax=Streptomyces sp. MBT58 TaxID=1488389 RepID=UPI001F3F9357|nr:hypothetical protein [Streptomyces sp. MBT58]
MVRRAPGAGARRGCGQAGPLSDPFGRRTDYSYRNSKATGSNATEINAHLHYKASGFGIL